MTEPSQPITLKVLEDAREVIDQHAPGYTVLLNDLETAIKTLDSLDLNELRIEENRRIAEALRRTQNNQSQAARLLGITRYALRYKMQKLGLIK